MTLLYWALGFILLLLCAILANIMKLIVFEEIDEVDVLHCRLPGGRN